MENKPIDVLPEPGAELTTATVKIGPAYDPAIQNLINEIAGVKRSAAALQIKDDDGAEAVTDDLTIAKDLKKALETLRKSYTVPLNDHVTNINVTFKAIMVPLTEADGLFRSKLLAWKQYQRGKAEKLEEIERQKVALAQAEAEVTGAEPPVIEPVKHEPVSGMTRAGLGTSNTQDVWKWELLNIDDVPREYLHLNSALITGVVKSGVREIKGIRIYNEPTISVRARKAE